MKESIGGFSIREYALNMRSIDIVKCWPFRSDSSNMNKQDMAAKLPPMTVTKFRYWRDELESMKKTQQPNRDMHENSTGVGSNEQRAEFLNNLDAKFDDELVCPVCKRFSADTVKAVNAHIDSCFAQISRRRVIKGKSKAPKKRSIVEIFAETPQIENIEVKDDGKGFAASNVKSSLKGMKMNKKKMSKKRSQTIKKKSKELKPCSLPRSTKKVCCLSHHRRSTLGTLDAAPSKTKKRESKFIKKCTQPFKLIAKKQKSKISSCGILNNCKNVTEQSSSTVCNRPGSRNNCPSSSQQLKRHDFFSDAFGVLGNKEHRAEGLTELYAVQGTCDDHALCCIGKEAEVQQASEKGLIYGTHDQEKVKHFPVKLVAQSQAAVHDVRYSHDGIRISSDCELYVGNPRATTLSEGNYSVISTQAGTSAARFPISAGQLTNHFEHGALGMAAISSLAGGRACLQPSLSSFPLNENQDGPSHLPQLPTQNITGHTIGQQSRCGPPCIQLIGNCSNHPARGQRNLRLEEGYNLGNCGLPLNSQGELIQSGLGSYFGNNHRHPLTLDTVSGSSTTVPFHRHYLPGQTDNYVNERTKCSRMIQKDQLNLFPLHRYVKENSEAEFSLRANLANSESFGRAVICPDSDRRCVLGSSSSLNMSYQGCDRQYDQMTNQRGKGMIQLQNHDGNNFNNPQPTMRLMGKDVTVAHTSKEMTYLGDRNYSADKEFVLGYHPSTSTQNDYLEKNSSMQISGSHTRAGKLREPVPDYFIDQNSRSLESYSMKRNPEHTSPYINFDTNSGLRNGSLTNQHPSSEHYFFTDPPSAPAMFNQEKNFREQYGPVTQSFTMPSTYQDAYQHTQSRSGLGLSSAKSRGSIFGFPFLHPDDGIDFHETRLQNTKGLPQLSHPRWQNQSSKYYPQSYSDVVSKGHPPSTFGICILSGPEIHCQARAYYPLNSMTSHMPMTISPFAESVPNPTLPSTSATSAIDRCRNTVKPKDMKLKAAATDPYHCNEIRKRPADLDYISSRPSKMLNINAQEHSKALEKLGPVIPVDHCIDDFALYRSQAGNMECNFNATPKDMLGNPFDVQSSKLGANAKCGTIKLSAGAKHILKPSLNVDEEKFTPIYTAVPLSALTFSDSLMDLQKVTRTFPL